MSDDDKTVTPQAGAAKAPFGRGLRVLLFVSLAANLVIVGLVAGAVLGKDQGGSKRLPRDADFMGAFTRALPEEDRRAIGRDIRQHHRQSGITRDAARAEFEAMLTLLRATPFDAERLKARLTRQAETTFDRRSVAQDFWIARVSAMSPAERLDYADQIEAQLKQMQRKAIPNKK